MSIAKLRHATLVGPRSKKAEVLHHLQRAAVMHVVPLVSGQGEPASVVKEEARAALRYLREAPIQRAPTRRPPHDLEAIENRALALRQRQAELEDERDYLRAKERALEPWGEFSLPKLGSLGQTPEGPVRLWFYEVPSFRLDRLRSQPVVWQEVARRAGVAYVVVLAAEEPENMPVPRTQAGALSLSQVRQRLAEVEERLDDLRFERADLTKYADHFEAELDRFLDRAVLEEVSGQAWDEGALFALAGWVAEADLPRLDEIARRHRLAVWTREPTVADEPPTQLTNRGLARAGESLVTFYMTPGYFDWDPSWAVLLSFCLFFAMILSDAGYAVLLLGLLLLFWRKAGAVLSSPLRSLFAVTLGVSAVWGVVVGSYFGVAPPSEGTWAWVSSLQRLRLDDYDSMMQVSVGVGALHVILGNLLKAWWVPRAGVGGALGWSLAVLTGLLCWWTLDTPWAQPVQWGAPWAFGVALFLIIGFSSSEPRVATRLGAGFLSLTQVTAAFGDVLSYLRLFALGLASSSLALAFNDLARSASQVEGVGLLFAILVLGLGHAINLALAIMGGFVHGLRLNFIEFFRWGTTSEGHPFRAFARRRSPAEEMVGRE